ncbi:MAG TPA: TonB-dependent receptor, partial [Terriglobia bacterium]|nr:TonB-dependent receptor [Terriglobia bacterium]
MSTSGSNHIRLSVRRFSTTVRQVLGEWVFCFSTLALALWGWPTSSFGQTTGQISGTVKDETGGVIVCAEVKAIHSGSLETRTHFTDSTGVYFVPLLIPGLYEVSISASGFSQARFTDVSVTIINTTLLDATLKLSSLSDEVTVQALTPLVQKDGPQLGSVVDSRTAQTLPAATRDFTHLLALSPGASAPLVDHKELGRNSQDVTVNGARVTQNGYQINGVNANHWGTNTALRIARPALESVEELKIQTSLYDATQAGGGGGSIRLVTQSGGNDLHGVAYGYLQNDAFNANDPFLKAANARRPVLRRNVYGGTVGGPIRKGGTYFFTSYQGIRELNGLSDLSLSSDVLIAPCVAGTCLSDDRSAATLLALYKPTFPNGEPANSINPVALTRLNTKLPNGNFLIPTPQSNGRYSGSTPSSYAEDQINANLDSRLGQSNWLSTRIFLANAGSDETLRAGPNVPGFGVHLPYDNCLATVQLKSTLSARAVNDLRIGYNFIRSDLFAKESIRDSDVGIRRPNAGTKPGLGLIRIAPDANGIAFGSALRDFQDIATSATVADLVMVNRGAHGIRLGAEGSYLRNILRFQHNGRGQIDFSNFNDFLVGAPRLSVFGVGIGELDLRSTSYALFIQDDWKVVSKLTINLGLRYELSLPPYDTRGRISTFDPALYKPRLEADNARRPLGPPAGGFVQAGNVISQYDLPEVTNVAPRVLESLDTNNLAPRIGIAYSPTHSDRVVVRAGYGMFYSPSSANYSSAFQVPPYYLIARIPSPLFEDPFAGLPAPQEFPMVPKGALLGNPVFDRGIRSPYVHQYNFRIQYSVGAHRLVEAAYVGSRGLNLRRVVALNQARLASPQQPI